MNQTAKNTLFFTSVLALVTAGSVFSAVRSNDRPSEISGPVLMEQSAGGPVDKAPGNTSGDASPASGEKHVSPETAPAKVKPSVPPVFEERKNRPADDEGRARLKNIDAAAVSDGERAGLLLEKSQESSLSAAPAASTDAATEQTGVEELVYEDPASRDRPSLILAVFRVLLSLAAVAGCVVLCGFGLKKFMDKRSSFTFKQPLVNVLSQTYLGPRKTIYVVEVMGKILVLGATEGNIQMLTEMDPAILEKTLKEKKIEPPAPGRQPSSGFKGYLNAVLERFK